MSESSPLPNWFWLLLVALAAALLAVAWWDWTTEKIKEAMPLLLSEDLDEFLDRYDDASTTN